LTVARYQYIIHSCIKIKLEYDAKIKEIQSETKIVLENQKQEHDSKQSLTVVNFEKIAMFYIT